jgi:hypothetical protein
MDEQECSSILQNEELLQEEKRIIEEVFSPKQETKTEKDKLGFFQSSFNYYVDEVTPYAFVSLVLLYLFGKTWPFAPYIIVIGTLILIVTLFLNMYRYASKYGWLFSFRECLRLLLGRGWVTLVLGYEKIKGSWFGKTAILFALTNLGLLVHWAWYNFPLTQIAKNGFYLAISFLAAFSDPPAILQAFDIWLKTIPSLQAFIQICDFYLTEVLIANENHNPLVLFTILSVSAGLFLFALCFYSLFTFIIRKKYCCCKKELC